MGVFNEKTLKSMTYLLVLLIVALLFERYIYDGTVSQLSNIDNRYYKVRAGKDKQLRADLLAFLNIKLNILVATLENDPRYRLDPNVQRLIKNWKKGAVIKEVGNMESDAAYVINKQYMSFCLQDSPNGKVKTKSLEDTNLITYVGIHELAHVMSVSIDHDQEFITNFEFLLKYASGILYQNPFTGVTEKLYTPLSELKTADNYCGVKITNSIN